MCGGRYLKDGVGSFGTNVGTIPVKGDFINNLYLASEGYRGLI